MRRRQFLKGSLGAGIGLWGVCSSPSKAVQGPPKGKFSGSITPIDLGVEALGVSVTDAFRPRLHWKLSAEEGTRNQTQTAYRILVASSEELLFSGAPDLWDTGKVVSDRQLHVEYEGRALESGQQYYWRVEVWDGDDAPAAGLEVGWWEMGLMLPEDWEAQWISSGKHLSSNDEAFYEDHPAPLFRRSFRIEKSVRRARWYTSALGYVVLFCNGEHSSEDVLSPAWTDTEKTLYYTCHDVTHLLTAGENVLGATLGNGWRNPLPLRMWGRINIREHLPVGRPKFLSMLVIDYEDGSTERIGTEDAWRVSDGPLLRNSVYLGETYDARLEQPGWNAPGFDDSTWQPVCVEPETWAEIGQLCAQPLPPIRITKRLNPVSWHEIEPGKWIVDLGQNFAGWVRLRVEGPRGSTVQLRMGELLYEDGTLNPMTAVAGQIKRNTAAGISVGGPGAPEVAQQVITYTLKGEGLEDFSPRFTFHGFRYVEVTGYPGTPPEWAIQGLRLNTDVERAGSFRCSNDMFNRLDEVVRWTLLSNLFSVQSDCPAREKFQYGGDIVSSSEMAMFSFDMAAFYAKAVNDFRDAAMNGWFTETAPFVGIQAANYVEWSGPIGWGLAHPLLLDQLYRYYGDRRLMEEHYAAARDWVDLLAGNADGFIIDRCIGDHESLDPKPIALVATAQFYQAAAMVASFASKLGLANEAVYYDRLAQDIREAFVERFLDPGTGRFDTATQACQATALYMGLVPESEHPRAVRRMVDAVVKDHGGHIAAGIFGTKYLLNALVTEGHADIAYRLVNQRTYPGWGHMLENGATTLWETWAQSDNVYSQNHPMFGSVVEWLYRCIGGINPDEDAEGFDRFVLSPHFDPDLDWADISYASVRGDITCSWKRMEEGLCVNVTVPVNTRAVLVLPSESTDRIQEGSKPLDEILEVSLLPGVRHGEVRLAVGSGSYRFTVRTA